MQIAIGIPICPPIFLNDAPIGLFDDLRLHNQLLLRTGQSYKKAFVCYMA